MAGRIVNWSPGLVITLDPDDIDVIDFDMTGIAGGDVIASVTVTGSGGIAAVYLSHTPEGVVSVSVSKLTGSALTTGAVTVQLIMTAAGRKKSRTLQFAIAEE